MNIISKENLFIGLVNTEMNKTILEKIMYTYHFKDMSAFIYERGTDTINVIKERDTALWKMAYKNILKAPWSIDTMATFFLKKFGVSIFKNKDMPLYVFWSNILFAPIKFFIDVNVQADIYAMIGEYFAIPSSIHEVLIVPKKDFSEVSIENIKDKMSEVNEMVSMNFFNNFNEMLSNYAFEYTKKYGLKG